MKIRKGTKKDMNELLKLEVELIKYVRKFDSSIKLKKSEKELKKEYEKQFKRNRRNWFVIVAEHNGKIIGFNKSFIKKSTYSAEKHIGCIANVFVKRAWRGKGITKQLLDEAIEIMKKKGIKIFDICSHKENRRALAAWKKAGFKKHAIIFEKKT